MTKEEIREEIELCYFSFTEPMSLDKLERYIHERAEESLACSSCITEEARRRIDVAIEWGNEIKYE